MIYVVEDEPVLLRSLVGYLRDTGSAVEGFPDAEQALAAAQESTPDLVVSDLQLPGMDGLSLLAAMANLDPGIVRIVMTAHSSVQTAVKAMRQGCYEYLEKPLDLQQLARLVRRALEERRSGRELGWLRDAAPAVPGLVGESPALDEVRQQIAALERLGTELPPVLITGETGVGKGVVARAIFNACFSADAPWIEVNCPAIPESLIEGELLGFERSAFTDAKQAKPGLFEAATGGVIFLDEIGEIPLSLQAKLLKVVESSSVRRLGAVRDRPVSTAVIAASNLDLETATANGRFRSDLFHRLAAFTIYVPPLRERGNDVVMLAEHFLRQSCERYRKAVRRLSAETARLVADAPWPGNVRELRFAVERAVIMTPATTVELPVNHLRVDARPNASVSAGESGIRVDLPDSGVDFADLERAILEAALRQTGGNTVRAARLLGLKRDAVRYRMRKLRLKGDG